MTLLTASPDALSGQDIRALAVLAAYRDEPGFERDLALKEFGQGLARRLAEVIVDEGVDAPHPNLRGHLEQVRLTAEMSFGLQPRAA